MPKLLALDPASSYVGLAYFDGPRLIEARLLDATPYGEIEGRLGFLAGAVGAWLDSYPVDAVAMERAAGYEDRRPAPELQAAINRLKREVGKHGFTVKKGNLTLYHPNTVVASVRLRGFRGSNKEVIAAGVKALYGVAGVRQDVLDAIAVGHCHLSKAREAELERVTPLTRAR